MAITSKKSWLLPKKADDFRINQPWDISIIENQHKCSSSRDFLSADKILAVQEIGSHEQLQSHFWLNMEVRYLGDVAIEHHFIYQIDTNLL